MRLYEIHEMYEIEMYEIEMYDEMYEIEMYEIEMHERGCVACECRETAESLLRAQ